MRTQLVWYYFKIVQPCLHSIGSPKCKDKFVGFVQNIHVLNDVLHFEKYGIGIPGFNMIRNVICQIIIPITGIMIIIPAKLCKFPHFCNCIRQAFHKFSYLLINLWYSLLSVSLNVLIQLLNFALLSFLDIS